MWPVCLEGVQWAVGSLLAPLFNNRTRLSTSAAIWTSRRPTGTWIRFTHVKCLWATRLQRKTSGSSTVPLTNCRGAVWPFNTCCFTLCAVYSSHALLFRKCFSMLVIHVVMVKWRCYFYFQFLMDGIYWQRFFIIFIISFSLHLFKHKEKQFIAGYHVCSAWRGTIHNKR